PRSHLAKGERIHEKTCPQSASCRRTARRRNRGAGRSWRRAGRPAVRRKLKREWSFQLPVLPADVAAARQAQEAGSGQVREPEDEGAAGPGEKGRRWNQWARQWARQRQRERPW